MQDQRPDSWHRWRLYGGWLVLWIALILVGLFVLLSVLIPWAMTGYVPAASGLGSKTLWDWMQLLLVPVVLAIGVSWFQHREKVYELEAGERQRRNEQYIADKKAEVDRAIADDYQQEALLSAYLDHMSDLLLNHHLRDSDIEPERGKDGYIYFPQMPEVQAVARARTLTNLRRLSNDRKVVGYHF